MKIITLYILGILLLVNFTYARSMPQIATTTCYQESPNIANACGGLATGSYDIYDGPMDSAFVLNLYYTIPVGALPTSQWLVKAGTLPATYYSIPTQCWNYGMSLPTHTLRFEIYSRNIDSAYFGEHFIACFNEKANAIVMERQQTVKYLNYCNDIFSLPLASNKLVDGNWNTYMLGSRIGVANDVCSDDSAIASSRIYEEAMVWKIFDY